MRAIVIARTGGPEVLELRDLPTPVPSRGEVRVRVRATAVNRADLLQRLGRYPAPHDAPQDIPGLEIAGEVEALGDGVVEWKPGDRVFGVVGGGGYAEHIVVHARMLARMPAGMSFEDAAAVPEAFITAFDAMVTQAGLSAGDSVLISAVGSGVGTAAVQIASAIGARPIGTSRSQPKLARARELGLCEGVCAEAGAFSAQVLAATNGRGVDVVLELVGGAYLGEDLRCATEGARIVLVGLLAGSSAPLDMGLLLRKRVELRGTVLRSRPLEEKIAAARAFEHHVVPLFEAGRLRAVRDRVFPLSQAGAAHAWMASNESFGKIVLDCCED